jgi:streptomycin 6-kinase
VPPDVRSKALALGGEGARWLQRLGAVVEQLEREWQIDVGPALAGGSDSFVAGATTRDGERAVFKLALPGPGTPHQIEALLRAGGHGYVRLLRHDADRQAMLQERLGPALAGLGLPVATQLEIICGALSSAWQVPPDPGFTSGAAKARSLAAFIAATWRELDGPCSERAVARALSFAETREAAFDPAGAVLVHGDAHAANTLLDPATRGAGAAFRLIDPDGLFAERACDLAVPMRGWSEELLAGETARLGRERCAQLSRLTGVGAQAIWEWGLIERVSTGLLALRVGREALGRELLAVAEAFAAGGGGA